MKLTGKSSRTEKRRPDYHPEQLKHMSAGFTLTINGSAPASEAKATPAPVKKKGGMSAEGRARIVAAQKARWAKIKGEKAPAAAKASTAPKAPTKQKRRPMSPAVKAKLSAMMKARWEAKKAG